MSKEIVVVDNGSQDGTRDLLRKLGGGCGLHDDDCRGGRRRSRNGVRELFGGPKADVALDHSHRKKVAGNMRGMMRMIVAGAGRRRTGRII